MGLGVRTSERKIKPWRFVRLRDNESRAAILLLYCLYFNLMGVKGVYEREREETCDAFCFGAISIY